jgi:hypothetical protein
MASSGLGKVSTSHWAPWDNPDFRPLLREDSPGIIGMPENWSADRIDSKLTALLMRHGPNYFRGSYRALAVEDQTPNDA